jgi:hypothetical protein
MPGFVVIYVFDFGCVETYTIIAACIVSSPTLSHLLAPLPCARTVYCMAVTQS